MKDESPKILVLEAGRSERGYWRDLWAYRELFLVLAARDIAVRYKQTFIGVAWAILRPLVTVVVFTLLFRDIAKMPGADGVPYALLVFGGMLPWYLVSGIWSSASESLVVNASLVSKVYFPRLIIPTSSAIVALIDFTITFVFMLVLMAWHGVSPTWRIVFLPAYTLLAVAIGLGPAWLLTALNVRYRDFRFIVPFLLQFGLYASPVGFPTSAVPEQWRFWYDLNPMVGLIEGFRWCLLGASSEFDPASLLSSIVVMVVFLWAGVTYFRRTEKSFADLV